MAHLPDWRMMLAEEQAAAYVSLPLVAFRRAVSHGEQPRRPAGHLRWSRISIEQRFHQSFPGEGAQIDPIAEAIEKWNIA